MYTELYLFIIYIYHSTTLVSCQSFSNNKVGLVWLSCFRLFCLSLYASDICTYLRKLIMLLQIQCHEDVSIFIIYVIQMQPIYNICNQYTIEEEENNLRSNTLGEIFLSNGTPCSWNINYWNNVGLNWPSFFTSVFLSVSVSIRHLYFSTQTYQFTVNSITWNCLYFWSVAAERSVHYFCDYFSSFFCATYFSPGRGCPRVMEFRSNPKTKIWGKQKLGPPLFLDLSS